MTDKNSKDTTQRKTSFRILALIGVLLLAALYGSTLVLALLNNPNANNLFMASIASTIIIPVLIYAYQFIYRLLKQKKDPVPGDERK